MTDTTNPQANSDTPNSSSSGMTGLSVEDLLEKYNAQKQRADQLETKAAKLGRDFASLQGKQAEWAESKTQIELLQSQLEQLGSAKEEAAAKAVSLEESVAQLQAKLSRNDSLMKFPDLIPLELDGVLPEGTGEELEAKLLKLSERLSASAKAAEADASNAERKRILEGATPPPPGTQMEQTAESIQKEMNAAMASGDTEKFNQLYEQYIKLEN